MIRVKGAGPAIRRRSSPLVGGHRGRGPIAARVRSRSAKYSWRVDHPVAVVLLRVAMITASRVFKAATTATASSSAAAFVPRVPTNVFSFITIVAAVWSSAALRWTMLVIVDAVVIVLASFQVRASITRLKSLCKKETTSISVCSQGNA